MDSKLKTEKENILQMISEGKKYNEIAKYYGYKRTNNFKIAAIKNGIIPDKNGKYQEITFKCKFCGKEFENSQKLGGHTTYCEKNPNIEKNLDNLKIARENVDIEKRCTHEKMKCSFCGKEVHGKGCLVLHEKHCKSNPNYVPKVVTSKGKSHVAWNKGKTMMSDKRILDATEKRKKSIQNGNFVPKGVKHTETTKEVLRKKAIDYIKKCGNGTFNQRFSIKGCEFIDKLNEAKGWHLQHALNGGEFEFCGYFLDGYDKELNIAFEYDEPKHYKDVYNNILKDKDIERQNYIMNYLNCEFYRFNEKLGYFYKI